MQFADQYSNPDDTYDLNLTPPTRETPVEGDWNDEEDEDFDDQMEFEDDMNEIRTGDDAGEPDPEDDDHMPNGDMK